MSLYLQGEEHSDLGRPQGATTMTPALQSPLFFAIMFLFACLFLVTLDLKQDAEDNNKFRSANQTLY